MSYIVNLNLTIIIRIQYLFIFKIIKKEIMFSLFGNSLSRMGWQSAAANRALILNKDLPLRRLKLHEYQAGRLLHKYRVPIPLGNVAFNGKEAFLVAK